MVLETIRMAPERPRTVPEGLGSAPEGSGMSRNDPGRSWKLLEGSGQYHSLPHAPSLGGKPPMLPQVVRGVGGRNMGGILLQVGLQSSLEEDSPVGRTPFGSRSPKGTPHLLGRPRQPLGHLYNEGEGQGAQLDETLAPWRLPSLSKPRLLHN